MDTKPQNHKTTKPRSTDNQSETGCGDKTTPLARWGTLEVAAGPFCPAYQPTSACGTFEPAYAAWDNKATAGTLSACLEQHPRVKQKRLWAVRGDRHAKACWAQSKNALWLTPVLLVLIISQTRKGETSLQSILGPPPAEKSNFQGLVCMTKMSSWPKWLRAVTTFPWEMIFFQSGGRRIVSPSLKPW